uniref:hypothetical protein n=1 Tax=uncultured Erythrobacter sp. TaxID=263913 RepID=UPI002604D6E3|nr:hypothetical protein [uncultured Erythrobacter sp.]
MSWASFTREVDEAQPSWSKWLWRLAALPAWFIFGIAIVSTFDGDAFPVWGWVAGAVFGAITLMKYYKWGNRD